MSGIYIPYLDLPKDEAVGLFVYPNGKVHVWRSNSMVGQEYEAIPVPEHGDLIDYDFCMENYELLHDDDGNPVYAVRMRDINNAPTIIPASGKEGEG